MLPLLSRLVVAAPLLFLAGCMTVAPHTVSQDTIRDLKIVDVEVTGGEAIRSWPEGENAYAKSAGADPAIVQGLQTKSVAAFPPVRDFITAELRGIFKTELETRFQPVFAGSRPARAVIHLKTFDVPSSARLILVSQSAEFDADITLVDAKTGASILFYAGNSASRYLSGGVIAPMMRAVAGDEGRPLIERFFQKYREWLLRNGQS